MNGHVIQPHHSDSKICSQVFKYKFIQKLHSSEMTPVMAGTWVACNYSVESAPVCGTVRRGHQREMTSPSISG